MKNLNFSILKYLIISLLAIQTVGLVSCEDLSLNAPKGLIIILKADDLGETTENWNQFIKIVTDSDICAGIGIISKNVKSGNSLNEIRRVSTIKQVNNFPVIEFWNHGYDHLDQGQNTEFRGTDYNYQLEHFQKTQKFFSDSLHIICHSFGAPHNRTSLETNKVLENFSEINVWQYYRKIETNYQKPWKDPDNVVIKNSDKNLILNIDYLFFPNFKLDKIVTNYDIDKKKPYIIIQLHPLGWDSESFENFKAMIHFYKENNRAVFMTPYQYYKFLHNEYISN